MTCSSGFTFGSKFIEDTCILSIFRSKPKFFLPNSTFFGISFPFITMEFASGNIGDDIQPVEEPNAGEFYEIFPQ